MDTSPKTGQTNQGNQEIHVNVGESGGSVIVALGGVSTDYTDVRSGGPSTSRDNHEAEDTSNTQGIGVCDILVFL